METPESASHSLYEALAPGEIRVVQILPGAERSELECLLKVLPLADGDYIALSYTWGKAEFPEYAVSQNTDEPDTYDIRVNESTVTVSQNLYHFLVDTRPCLAPGIWFWIDALSINQADLEEKAIQVNQMGRIYRSASRVLVWLGRSNECTPGVRLMMTHLSDAIEAKRDSDGSPYTAFLGLDSTDDKAQMARIGLEKANVTDWAHLAAFLFRRWFHRLWTMQEITLARDLEFRCGSYNFPWKIILRTMTLIAKTRLTFDLFRILGNHFGRYPVLNGAGLQVKFFEESRLFYSEEKLTSNAVVVLVFLASSLRSSGAADSRDKIFGMLGIMSVVEPMCRQPFHIKADYTRSTVDLYQEVMAAFVKETGTLTCLSMVQSYGDKRIPDLPSWVLDFTGSEVWSSLPALLRDKPADYRPFDASRDTTRGISIEGHRLRIYCLKFSSIALVGYGFAEPWAECSPTETYAELALKSRLTSRHVAEDMWKLPVVHETYNMSAELESKFRSSFRAQVLRECVAKVKIGREKRGITRSAAFAEWPNLFELMRVDETGAVPTEKELFDRCDALGCYEDGDIVGNDEHQKLWRSMEIEAQLWHSAARIYDRRRPFLTENGYLGFGPRKVMPSDEVCIIADGGRTPFVSRIAEDGALPRRRHIGEAYVPGIMYGEAVTELEAKGVKWHQIDII